MSSRGAAPARRDLVIGVSPFGHPDAKLVAAVCRAGALGVLDLRAGGRRCDEALHWLARRVPGGFGVRLGAGCAASPGDLPAQVDTVLLASGAPSQPGHIASRRRVLVEVTSLEEALDAARRGAHGVLARGTEAGGAVGELGTFVLLQQLLAALPSDFPVWAWGGIGLGTAAAAVVGGAAGVVLDSQLALVRESDLPEEVAGAVRRMDGSETVLHEGRRVLRRAPIEVGQDGCLAQWFAQRFRTAAGAVRATRESILRALDDGDDVLREGTAMSRALGTRLPLAQGPMTRVSDGARFAAAVAQQGALPFLALALADREQTRAMLEQARAAMGERPWGVGVLGFAPDETRAAQLEVIRETRPSCAVIAGGLPAQAAVLEAAGIPAFLHVPSPTLLRQFLEAGARRFVFEGSECGGHVGPRSSFALWEAQLAVLADFLEARPQAPAGDEIQVLFAGGIHDARSAAMVAAVAQPLARRGVAVGVLMGTAYLFTQEAVASGAIQPLFQRQVLDARRTELLETAPGHVTRCIASPFASSFRAVKDGLRAGGADERRTWEELERLNLGRLRIASKGLKRRGRELVAVGEAEQLAEGLFMAGEVAVLRSAPTTIAALHASVSDEAAAFLEARRRELRRRLQPIEAQPEPQPAAPAPLDVAIVGMACLFPGSPDLTSFWAHVVGGADLVTEVPPERWDPALYYAPQSGEGPRTSSRWGGFLPRIPFDALRYGIPPSSLPSIEPVQLLALEAARRALEDAGYADRPLDRARVSVVFGAEAGSDLSNAAVLRTVLPAYLGEVPEQIDAQLPRLTEDSFPGMLSNVIAGRIANRLDLGGASYTVDAACASSLAAVDLACKELAVGASDLVLCGGADVHNGIHDYLLFDSVNALSATGRCRTFAASADGIVLGEGVACLVLKRLAEAERDGDRIYAVIRGVGSASDGKSVGLTAPRPEGQRSALERAYRNAGITPADVGLVEAHGTGTVVGDRTELATLTSLFAQAGAAPGACALGSVKSQIGHTKCAAGMAGLIKAALAVHCGVRPPTLHLDEPNPGWEAATSPFSFAREARPWAAPAPERVAGVSAFGFGGTNFHVVVQGHADAQPRRHALHAWPAELFTFRGADPGEACRSVELLQELVAANDAHGRPWRLRDLAATAASISDQRQGAVQVALVAADLDDLGSLLRRAAAGDHDPDRGLFRARDGEAAGKLAVLFPGQGSQRPGMLAELFTAFPEVQEYLQLGPRWADVLFPAGAFDAAELRDQEARLRDTRCAQPALGIAGLAVHHLLTRLEVAPDMLAGHSYGELVALHAAGACDSAALLRLSEARAEAILAAAGEDPGTMGAVSASAAEVEQVLEAAGLAGEVVLANRNAPRQVVISGPTQAVERALAQLQAAGHAATPIRVACAFHSPGLAAAGPRFARALAAERLRDLELPVWSNRTAARYPVGAEDVRAELVAQLAAPVRFAEQIEAMYAEGARIFLEAGPGRVLTALVDAILDGRPHHAIACEGSGGGLRGFLSAIAQLAVAGVRLRTGWLFGGRDARDVSREAPPPPPGWTVDGHAVRTSDGAFLPGGLVPARRVAIAAPGTNEDVITQFLRTSREIVAAQRDVLLSYLGAAGTPPPAPPTVDVAPAPAVAAPAVETSVLDAVLGIISERTGYPVDMIEPGLDLEADLSIDSIKRTEIVGELARRLGLAGGAGALTEGEIKELIAARTANAIVAWFEGRIAEPGGADATVPGDAAPPRRFVLEPTPLDGGVADASILAGTRFVLLGGGDVATALAIELTAHGASIGAAGEVRERTAPLDGVIWLDALGEDDEPLLPEAFPTLQAALAREPRWLLAACPADGGNGGGRGLGRGRVGGLRGLFRTVAREHPEVHAALVEVDPAAAPEAIARLLVHELLARDPAPLVRRVDEMRYALHLVEAPLREGDQSAEHTGPRGVLEAQALGLAADSVVLLVGGARGITAHLATTLAAASACRLELVGRTPTRDGTEHPAIAAAPDRQALRAALVQLGRRGPADIEREVARIMAQREIEATLDELRSLGASARYHALDAQDRDGMRRLIDDIHARHGRLDGAVFAAGVIEDRLLLDKDPDSFRRVFKTKVDGAAVLLHALEDLQDGPRFVVLFGSIAAVLGNRGQVDYAAANDALEELGTSWAARTGRRALTVHWGPWAPNGKHGGMVTPELQDEYRRRGIALIDPQLGPLCLLRELAWGADSARAVVYAASAW